MNQKTNIQALTFVMLFALYGIGFGFDWLLKFLREGASTAQFFGPWYQFWAVSLANLVLAFCVFWLFTRAFPALDRWALWMTAVLGLVANFVPILYWLGMGNFLAVFISQRGYFLLVGSFTAMAALFSLYKMKKAAA